MNPYFNIVMPLMIALLVWGGYALVRRTRERRTAWESGLTARARVVRAWATTQMVNNVARRVQWHEYDYTTGDGLAVRFKESGGPRDRAGGEEVLVYYTPADPEKATACEPQPGKDTAGMVFGLFFIGAAVIAILYAWTTVPEL
ncbi:hypothetical protein QF037_005837 [Streptomyces canus]|uniref:DUF3592 domain-containing protein n=1 Tax=Streptomyces canus TaxID=58343 RepID=UPI002781C0A6|nr:DUF3592 domain-containing protein [Streptomyces canus]MDQ0601492.1 hypothetical protein [Streptomyces canus]